MADFGSLPSWKKSLSILVVGLIGSGKSSLINSLFGLDPPRDTTAYLKPKPKSIQPYRFKCEGLTIDVCESPGLQAGMGYDDDDKTCISQMNDLGCADADLMLFCIRMDDIRFQQTHIDAFRSLTNGLGTKIWSKAIFVMTHTDFVNLRLGGKYVSFSSLLEEWRSQIVTAIQKAGVDTDIALCIPVVPVSNYDPSVDMIKSLRCTCISRIKEQLQAKGQGYQPEHWRMGFSPRMEPPELAKWFLDIYGEAYSVDINKLESAKINGELFLELEEDEELLKELNLSPAFKRLMKKKAKELKQSGTDVASVCASELPSIGVSTVQTITISSDQPQSTPVSIMLRTTDQLTKDHLSKLLNIMWPARTQFLNIGLMLGLEPATIDAIIKRYDNDTNECFIDMIKECLRQGLITQQKLADAVRSEPVGFEYLSEEILATVFTTQSAPPAVYVATNDRLSPNHLQQVLDLSWEARTKYYSIGLALDLPADTIDTIERSNNYRVEAIFMEMIKECLRQGLVTQVKLAKAVSSPQVGFAYLSDDILAKKLTASKATRSASPAVVTDADFDKFEVKHHFVSRLEWIDSATGERKCVRVYNSAAWRWRNVAESLGLEPGEIESARRNHYSDDERVIDVFRHWFDNANNLPNKKIYPKKWSGLIRLLDDSDLWQLSEEVEKALSAASSNVRGNLH